MQHISTTQRCEVLLTVWILYMADNSDDEISLTAAFDMFGSNSGIPQSGPRPGG